MTFRCTLGTCARALLQDLFSKQENVYVHTSFDIECLEKGKTLYMSGKRIINELGKYFTRSVEML